MLASGISFSMITGGKNSMQQTDFGWLLVIFIIERKSVRIAARMFFYVYIMCL